MGLLFTCTANYQMGQNRTRQIYKTMVLAGCNTILTVFHKQFHRIINYFMLGSHGAQRRKMLHVVDPANLLWVKTPGHFGYFATGPGIHPCALSSVGQYIHILDALKITSSVKKLLNCFRSKPLQSVISDSSSIYSTIKVGQIQGVNLKAYLYRF